MGHLDLVKLLIKKGLNTQLRNVVSLSYEDHFVELAWKRSGSIYFLT